MALMARSKHKTNKGKNSRPHPKNPKRQHSSTTLQARGGVKLKAARKAERNTGASAMQTDETQPNSASKVKKSVRGFKVGLKGKVKRGMKTKASSVAAKATADVSPAERGGDDADDFEDMLIGEQSPEIDSPEIPAGLLEKAQTAALTINQKKKAKQKQRTKKKSAVEFEATRSEASAISQADTKKQAAWFWRKFCEHSGTDPEQSGGIDCSSFVTLDGNCNLEQQLQSLAGAAWQQELASEQGRPAGSPSLLLISASAAVANDLIKLLPNLNQFCKVAKLFAKHFKLIEQQTLLTKRAPAVAVGTPNRLQQLANIQALKLGKLGLLLIDVALDAKQRTILDIPETVKDFWSLFTDHLGPLMTAGQLRIGLFDSSRYKSV